MTELLLSDGSIALIDDDDYQKASLLCWRASSRRTVTYARAYVRGSGRKNCKRVYLHRYLLELSPGFDVDHINGNGLDCRRTNMRVATKQQNRMNEGCCRKHSSIYKGVHWHRQTQLWRADIGYNGKTLTLGHFKIERDAAAAYDLAAIRLFGDFARTNIVVEAPQ